MAELCSGDIVADIRTIYQSKIGSESGRAGAQSRPNMDTASLVSDHHQFLVFCNWHFFWIPFIYLHLPFILWWPFLAFKLYIVSTNFFGSFLWSSGKGKGMGSTQEGHWKVIYRWWMVDGGWWISFPWCFTLNLVAPPTTTTHPYFSFFQCLWLEWLRKGR